MQTQANLIEATAEHRSLLEQLNKHTQNLQESQDINCVLEGKVKNFNEMRKYKGKAYSLDGRNLVIVIVRIYTSDRFGLHLFVVILFGCSILEMIADIDRQIAWTEYENKRDKLTEIKKDKESAQAIYNKYR